MSSSSSKSVARILHSQQSFRVRKIICIGRNYADHAKEMKADLPTEPVFFLKPPTAIIHEGGKIRIPAISNDLHHEVEMTILIGAEGSEIPPENALSHVAGYGIGLDMTLRDVQAEAKKKGLPWSLAKGFDTSAPLSDFVPAGSVPDPSRLQVRLGINGSRRQTGRLADLIFPVKTLVSYLSKYVTLEEGDVIFTGTPEGVGRVVPGDRLEAALMNEDGSELVTLRVGVA